MEADSRFLQSLIGGNLSLDGISIRHEEPSGGEDDVGVAIGYFLRLPCVWWQIPAAQNRKKTLSNCQKSLVVVTS